ncbi:MAG TPA: hypothetical protein VMZ69_02040 [Saprospiraceae bacterium]|nr:hypothetical protein [Saprospiraceae bacterium]
MIILRIEHKVPSYEGWKKAFDQDPVNRKNSGVIRYNIYRPADDPNYVIVDLEFDDPMQAHETLSALRKLWDKVEGSVMFGPQTQILEVIESVQL